MPRLAISTTMYPPKDLAMAFDVTILAFSCAFSRLDHQQDDDANFALFRLERLARLNEAYDSRVCEACGTPPQPSPSALGLVGAKSRGERVAVPLRFVEFG